MFINDYTAKRFNWPSSNFRPTRVGLLTRRWSRLHFGGKWIRDNGREIKIQIDAINLATYLNFQLQF